MIGKYIKLRVFLVGLAFIVLFAVIGAKAVHLQVYRSPWLAQKASSQYEKSLKSNGKRGTVYDRNLREMAVTIDVTSIGARTSKIKQPKAASRTLAKILKADRRYILKKLKSKGPLSGLSARPAKGNRCGKIAGFGRHRVCTRAQPLLSQ